MVSTWTLREAGQDSSTGRKSPNLEEIWKLSNVPSLGWDGGPGPLAWALPPRLFSSSHTAGHSSGSRGSYTSQSGSSGGFPWRAALIVSRPLASYKVKKSLCSPSRPCFKKELRTRNPLQTVERTASMSGDPISASLPIPTPNTQPPSHQPKRPGPVWTILLLQNTDCGKSISTYYYKHPTQFVKVTN